MTNKSQKTNSKYHSNPSLQPTAKKASPLKKAPTSGKGKTPPMVKEMKRNNPAPAPKTVLVAKPAKEIKPVKQLICLLGDEGLVKEYSAMFQEHGIAVLELKNLASLKNSAKKITAAFELTLLWGEQKSKNLQGLDSALPAGIPIVSNAITTTILSQVQPLTHRHRVIGIAAFPTLLANELVELAPSLHTGKETAEAVTALFTTVKKETAMVQDSVGMVMPRILCQIINEALFTVQNDVATPSDIDEAMKLGTNYPLGPIAWGESIGFANVAGVLDAVYHHHHEERYRAAPLLRQMATAGVFWNVQKP